MYDQYDFAMRYVQQIKIQYTTILENAYFIFQIGASTFSTNVGAPMFIGLAGSAAATGIAVTMFEWHVRQFLILESNI